MNSLTFISRSKRRRYGEAIFRGLGLTALIVASGVLVSLVLGVLTLGIGAFLRYDAMLTVSLDRETLDIIGTDQSAVRTADYRAAIRESLISITGADDSPETTRALQAVISPGAEFVLSKRVSDKPQLIDKTITFAAPFSDMAQLYLKGRVSRDDPSDRRILTDQQMDWLDLLRDKKIVKRHFNGAFFWRGDSSYPELAGVAAGIIGSLIAVGIAITIAAPLGVITAVFLEEFAPKNWITDFIEINVNNLAAVPSIIFGLLGLTAFILFFGMPRSAPLVGGLVLALMTLPTIIISTRAALRSLPQSLKEGAQALGASRLEVVANPMLPAAAPGIITGIILGFAQALGETAPLLLIGMVAFVATPPASALDPSSALPVLVYLWAESPERAFVEKTAGAVIVLLFFLVILNGAAAYARRRFNPYER